MQILNIEQNTDAWYEARKGKITGSKLNGIVVKRGTGKKIGFYQLMADRLSVEEDGDEDDMSRGSRLEDEAREKLSEMLDRPIKQVGLCVSDENPNIAYSPDGLIEDEINPKVYSTGAEIKCLSTARHLQAFFEKEIPDEYMAQVYQSFIVNTDQKTLYFAFYDPRVTVKPLFYLTVKREDIVTEIESYKKYQEETLAEIETLLAQIAF